MTNYHSIFPLEIVVYPGEKVNLHIFEPRYIYLVKKAVEFDKPFIMGVMIKNHLQEIGTYVRVESVRKEYEDGKMDITIEGIKPVRILELIKSNDIHLPHNAIIFHLENEEQPLQKGILTNVYDLMLILHRELKIHKNFNKPVNELMSYDFAHHIGLSLEDEYHLLTLLKEDQRLELMRLHLMHLISIVKNIESLKDRVRLNGNFRNLKGFEFD